MPSGAGVEASEVSGPGKDCRIRCHETMTVERCSNDDAVGGITVQMAKQTCPNRDIAVNG